MSVTLGVGAMDESEVMSFIKGSRAGILTLIDGGKPYPVPVEHYFDGKNLYPLVIEEFTSRSHLALMPSLDNHLILLCNNTRSIHNIRLYCAPHILDELHHSMLAVTWFGPGQFRRRGDGYRRFPVNIISQHVHSSLSIT